MPLRRPMRNLFLFIIFGCAAVGLTPVQTVAHGQLDEQIAAVTRQIQHDPRNARLYLSRGELHRHHRKWTRPGRITTVRLALPQRLLPWTLLAPECGSTPVVPARESSHSTVS